ncbi:MAG: DNA repair protein RecO [Candidatus Jidaibacter sp.]|nr:DNA repair protein RecO [Candidatus Jidaibacter sp.]
MGKNGFGDIATTPIFQVNGVYAMHIEGQAIVLKNTKFQESASIVECFTREHGVLKGFIRSGKVSQSINDGALVHIDLKARLETHLGTLKIEMIKNHLAHIGFDRLKLKLLKCILNMSVKLLRERDPHANLYDNMISFLDKLCNEVSVIEILKAYALLEVKFMEEAGYGLDLSKCVVTNVTKDLFYISPKSGCAVSRETGKPYDNKLFKMPQFYLKGRESLIHESDYEAVIEALKLNEFFLWKRVFEPNNLKMPEGRGDLVNLALKSYEETETFRKASC